MGWQYEPTAVCGSSRIRTERNRAMKQTVAPEHRIWLQSLHSRIALSYNMIVRDMQTREGVDWFQRQQQQQQQHNQSTEQLSRIPPPIARPQFEQQQQQGIEYYGSKRNGRRRRNVMWNVRGELNNSKSQKRHSNNNINNNNNLIFVVVGFFRFRFGSNGTGWVSQIRGSSWDWYFDWFIHEKDEQLSQSRGKPNLNNLT